MGAGVAGSAIGMDKIFMKAALKAFALPVGTICGLRQPGGKAKNELAEEIAVKLGFPCFVKPANLGSSVGVNKVYAKSHWNRRWRKLCSDHRVIVEKFLAGREIECSVLGNDEPKLLYREK